MDSPPLVLRRLSLVFMLVFSLFTIACAEREDFATYAHKGFSVEYPTSWKFKRDQDFSLDGSREVIFDLGEVSFVAFYFNDRLTFSEFTKQYIDNVYLKDATGSAKLISQTPFDVAGRKGLDFQVTAKFIGTLNTRVITVDVSQNGESVFLVAATADEDGLDIQPLLKHVVSSIRIDK
ncbi:hypothetical protein L1F30_07915 [Simiduia sp. 21SJ11W-1]|uniref:hypothetical protein n=1 Tax=Simiduia sp. 21SJ11W-1 TaxID=2909669 RepID=UPI0020A016F0|nr:hypothetical protein [Simiduia sp. 21SJ11W-1]UTA49450.1 hypothetical protein L1F30_07915 [Simiduia sp. 21SJ11W-1]